MQLSPGPVTKILAAFNILIAAIMLIPSLWEAMMLAGALFPARFFVGDAAFANVAFILPVWLTPISSAFLHAGILHVGLNMLMLLVVGAGLERLLGSKLFLLLYVAGILVSAAAEILIKPASMIPVVGASGAISALFASHMQLFPRQEQKKWGPLPPRIGHIVKLFAFWCVFNAMLWFVGPDIGLNIAIWAHIGGFAAGLLLTWPLMRWRFRKKLGA